MIPTPSFFLRWLAALAVPLAAAVVEKHGFASTLCSAPKKLTRRWAMSFAFFVIGVSAAMAGQPLYVIYNDSKIGTYDSDTGAAIQANLVTGLNSPRQMVIKNNIIYVTAVQNKQEWGEGVVEWRALDGQWFQGERQWDLPQIQGGPQIPFERNLLVSLSRVPGTGEANLRDKKELLYLDVDLMRTPCCFSPALASAPAAANVATPGTSLVASPLGQSRSIQRCPTILIKRRARGSCKSPPR